VDGPVDEAAAAPGGYEDVRADVGLPERGALGPSTGAAGTAVALAVAAEEVPTQPEPALVAVPGGVATVVATSVVVTVLFGVWPAPVVDFAHQATLLFR
jgi:hypothetical protein